MDINATRLPSNVQKTEDLSAFLRVNQRFSAEVLQVSGDRVVLSVQGVQVVARMIASGAASELMERRTAAFVVRDATPNNFTVQLLPQPAQGQTAAATLGTDLAPQLLKQFGLDGDEQNLMIARSLIARGMPIDQETVTELRTLLSSLGKWGSAELETALAIKNSGMPLTSGTLSLALAASTFEISDSIHSLQTSLQKLGQNNPQLAPLVQEAQNFLESISVDWNQSSQMLPEKLKHALNTLGHTLERNITDLLQKGSAQIDGSNTEGLLTLARLRQGLAETQPNHPLIKEVDRFIEGMRMLQWVNTEPIVPPPQGQSLNMEIPLRLYEKGSQAENEYYPARLRVAFKNEGGARKIDPNFTNLTIQLDVSENETFEVDLSIVNRQVLAIVSTPNEPLKQLAEEEFPTLTDGLSKVGYELKSGRFEVRVPPPLSPLGPSAEPKRKMDPLHSVDLDV